MTFPSKCPSVWFENTCLVQRHDFGGLALSQWILRHGHCQHGLRQGLQGILGPTEACWKLGPSCFKWNVELYSFASFYMLYWCTHISSDKIARNWVSPISKQNLKLQLLKMTGCISLVNQRCQAKKSHLSGLGIDGPYMKNGAFSEKIFEVTVGFEKLPPLITRFTRGYIPYHSICICTTSPHIKGCLPCHSSGSSSSASGSSRRPPKSTRKLKPWPSRNSEFSHEKWWFSIVM